MKFKLLISDDSTLVRKNIKRLLNNIEFLEISESRDTVETINAIINEKPHILLLDIRMPQGSGYDVLRYLREQDQKPMIIILTNNSSEENRMNCIDEGADFFFDKSTQHKEAITEIKKAITSFSRLEDCQ